MQRWMRWFVDHKHNVYLVTDQPSRMAGITEYDISNRDHYNGSRINRYIRFEFNMYYLRLVSKILKIDLLKKILMVRRIIASIKPDILHLHTLLYPSYLGVFTNFHPLVVTPWNGDILWQDQRSYIRRYAIQSGLHKAGLITVDSEELRLKTLRYGGYENKIEYISFGVDTVMFQLQKRSSDLRKRLNVEPDAPVVLSNRSLETLYNIDIIIKAIPMVLGAFPRTVFLFAWYSAPRKDYLMKLAENLGVTANIRLIGKIEHRDLPTYYAESDIFVSIPNSDTIAISLLEAMACGVAPVVSDLSSTKECIIDGVNGYVVPLRNAEETANAIIRLLSNDSLRKSFVKMNREWVVQHADWNSNMKKVEELYYKLAFEKAS
jgi:glycosyltransferase involved in cell wall biosynthesis